MWRRLGRRREGLHVGEKAKFKFVIKKSNALTKFGSSK
jgi:hypothetical protein